MDWKVLTTIGSFALAIASFIVARKKDNKTDTKEEAYRQGQIDEKLNTITKQLGIINEKLDKYDKSLEDFRLKLEDEVDTKIKEAMDTHERIYHDKE